MGKNYTQELQYVRKWGIEMSLLCEIRISDIIETLSTMVALLIGVLSIRQSNKEIKMSNKQAMFEKRYEIYLLLQHMDEMNYVTIT